MMRTDKPLAEYRPLRNAAPHAPSKADPNRNYNRDESHLSVAIRHLNQAIDHAARGHYGRVRQARDAACIALESLPPEKLIIDPQWNYVTEGGGI